MFALVKNLKIRTQVILATAVMQLILVVVLAIASFAVIEHNLYAIAQQFQDVRIKAALEIVKNRGEHFSIQDGQLFSGDYSVNGKSELVDEINTAVGGYATLFMRDERVATNIVENGARAIGTHLPPGPVYDALFKAKQPYRGLTKVLGIDCFAAYDPLLDQNGEVVGALFVGFPKAVFFKTVEAMVWRIVAISVVFLGFLILGLQFLLKRKLMDPLHKVVDLVSHVKNGDLTRRLEGFGQDEIGVMAQNFNAMLENLQNMLTTIQTDAATLSRSALELSAVSEQLSSSAEVMDEQTNSVAIAAETMSHSMQTVSAATEQTTTNTNTVAAAAEQMATSVREIAQNAENVRLEAMDAVSTVESASSRVDVLGNAAREIEQVIEMIVEIAEQTKLLALNATIEAARAGEAGKGFAVVASEVKDLAKQTNDATSDIRERISAIQQSTDATVAEIQQVSTIISRINTLMGSSAVAVEGQSIATQDIARSIHETAQGIQDVATNVGQTTQVTQQVAESISAVHAASAEVKSASLHVSTRAVELTQMGQSLQEIVSHFKV